MTRMEIKAIEHISRSPVFWAQGYDGQAHYSDVIKAVAPALFMLAIIAALMVTLSENDLLPYLPVLSSVTIT